MNLKLRSFLQCGAAPAVVLLTMVSAHAADISATPERRNVMMDDLYGISVSDAYLPGIYIKGEIVEGDYDRFMTVLRQLVGVQNLPSTVFLNSDGGDLLEAMKIGRVIRKLRLSTTVSPVGNDEQACASACMFLYFSGAKRYVTWIGQDWPTLILHRPHEEAAAFAKLSADQAEAEYARIEKQGREYLKEMSVPQPYIDRVFATSSASADILQPAELPDVWWTAPFLEELLIARCGSLTAAEKKEYMLANMQGGAAIDAYLQSPTGIKDTKIGACRMENLYLERARALPKVLRAAQ